VPFLAENFPGHYIFRLRTNPFGEFLESGDCTIKERPERRCIDFLPGMGVDLDFLPGAAQVFALHARAAAVGLDFVKVVQWFETEVGDEFRAVERLFGRAKLQFQ